MKLPLRHSDAAGGSQIGRFEAIFPQDEPSDRTVINSPMNSLVTAKYVKLTYQNESAILKVSKRNVAGIIFVSLSMLSQVQEKTEVEICDSSIIWYFIYRIRKEPAQKNVFIGLVLALLGVIIEASLGVGKVLPANLTFKFSALVLSYWSAFSFVLKAVGLCLAFYKSLLDAK